MMALAMTFGDGSTNENNPRIGGKIDSHHGWMEGLHFPIDRV
jgi:hypothetical protein